MFEESATAHFMDSEADSYEILFGVLTGPKAQTEARNITSTVPIVAVALGNTRAEWLTASGGWIPIPEFVEGSLVPDQIRNEAVRRVKSLRTETPHRQYVGLRVIADSTELELLDFVLSEVKTNLKIVIDTASLDDMSSVLLENQITLIDKLLVMFAETAANQNHLKQLRTEAHGLAHRVRVMVEELNLTIENSKGIWFAATGVANSLSVAAHALIHIKW